MKGETYRKFHVFNMGKSALVYYIKSNLSYKNSAMHK